MELVPNESSAALLPDEEVVREGILDNRPRTMSAPLESEEFVTFEVKINGERAGRLKSVSIQDGGAKFSHAPVIYPRSVSIQTRLTSQVLSNAETENIHCHKVSIRKVS